MVFPVIEWTYIYQVAFNMKISEHPLGDIFFRVQPQASHVRLHSIHFVRASASPLHAQVEIQTCVPLRQNTSSWVALIALISGF